jgi:hypothetical protein
MIGWTADQIFVSVALAVVAVFAALALTALTLCRPRWLFYLLLATTPLQFLFIPLGSFFVSPADIFVLAAAGGLTVRILLLHGPTWKALEQHVFVGLMLLGYALGFVMLGHFSRTLVRVLMAVIPSVLACELLRTRKHITLAAAAVAAAGVLDALYGVVSYSRGTWLHPTRFSGLMGVNFSAFVIIVSAAIWYAQVSRAKQSLNLVGPSALAGLGAATLSNMGVIAFLTAWFLVLSRVFTRVNQLLIVGSVTALVAAAISFGPTRARLVQRTQPEPQRDGILRTSADVRMMALRKSWQGFSQNPIAGIGFFGFQRFSATDPEINAATAGLGIVTHNTYVEILVEGGLLAFVPFVLHLLAYFRRMGLAWDAVWRKRDNVAAAALVGVPMVLLCAALANLLTLYCTWAILGLGMACLNLLEAEAQHPADASPTAVAA